MAAPRNNGIDHVKFCEHSRIIYWWPVWFFGYILGLLNRIYGDMYVFDQLEAGANWHSLLNLIYIIGIIFIIYVTNIRTSTTIALLVLAFVIIIVLLLVIFGGSGVIMKQVPSFSVYMNSKFYFTFSTGLLLIWAFTVFIVDQWVSAYLHAGSVTIKRLRSKKVYTMEGMIVSMTNDDFPCHHILGFGLMGDVELVAGAEKERQRIRISNAAFVGRKVEDARRMIAESTNLAPPGVN